MMYTAVTCLSPNIDEESNNEDYIGVNTTWIILLMIFISSPMTGNINQSRTKPIFNHHLELHQRHNILSPQFVIMVVSTRYIHLHFPFPTAIIADFLLKMVKFFPVDHSLSSGSLRTSRTTGNIKCCKGTQRDSNLGGNE